MGKPLEIEKIEITNSKKRGVEGMKGNWKGLEPDGTIGKREDNIRLNKLVLIKTRGDKTPQRSKVSLGGGITYFLGFPLYIVNEATIPSSSTE